MPQTCAPPRRNTPRPVRLTSPPTIIAFTSTATMPCSAPTAMPCSTAASRSARTNAASRPIRSPTTTTPDQLTVKGKVDFMDPKLRVRSDTGSYETAGGANFNQANFQLMDRNGRGFAKDIDVTPDGKVALDQVRYTSCPVGNDDWMLQAAQDQSRHQGPGRRRAQRDHALQGRADFLHALHLLSLGRRTQERRAVPELRPFRQQRLRYSRCPTTSTLRRTTT